MSYVTTIFQPDPTCIASSNLWLKSQPCYTVPYGEGGYDRECTYIQHGHEQVRESGYLVSDSCFPFGDAATVYTDCPEGYSAARTFSYGDAYKWEYMTACCPTAYEYIWGADPFTSLIDDEEKRVSLSNQPRCTATSVEVLYSQIITVTLATEPEVVTTTTELAETGVLFAEDWTLHGPTIYATPTRSTCWGARCPYSYEPSPTFPSDGIPSPMTTVFAAPSECLDPENLWIVTTSCYLEDQISTPDWLQCSVTYFGAPDWSDASCYQRADELSTINDAGEVVWYAGCPDGYSAVSSTSRPFSETWRYPIGYFDITAYNTQCCPTAYSFRDGDVRQTATEHDGVTYSLFVYPPPLCYATSVEALSGKEVPFNTWSNTMGWDKRQEDKPTTVPWDYERGTMFALHQQISYTVFMGTHTCYEGWEACSSWFHYYYPDGTGGPTPTMISSSEDGGPTNVESTGSVEPTGEVEGTASSRSGEGAVQTSPAATGLGVKVPCARQVLRVFWTLLGIAMIWS